MDLEIKVNKEILDYNESIILGLSFRQLLCSLAAVSIAVAVYMLLHETLGRELVSWVCLIAAAPFAVAGFYKYQGMTIEKFLAAVIKTQINSGIRVYVSRNLFLEAIEHQQRGSSNKNKKTKFLRRKNRNPAGTQD